MTDDQQKVFGRLVADLRKGRGLNQEELGSRIGRTASWVSQVERGVLHVRRLDVLQDLAQALGVSVQRLEPSLPIPQAPAPEPGEVNDLDGARLLISGHPILEVLLPPAGATPIPAPPIDHLTQQVDLAWALAHASRLAELTDTLQTLLPDLERAARVASRDQQAEAQYLLTRAYQALAASFVRQDEADAAWVAADRAIRAAEGSGRPLEVCASIYRLAQAFVRLRRLDQAEHAAQSAIDVLRRHIADREPSDPELAIIGSLYLVLALIHARGSRRPEARNDIKDARRTAQALSQDGRNDFDLEFGRSNVEIQAVATAVELGDAGEAIDIGHSIDASSLSPERQGRLLMDLGRAHVQRRQPGEALDCLLRAEDLAPEMVRSHVAAREAIRELVLMSGRTAPRELLELADRADARG